MAAYTQFKGRIYQWWYPCWKGTPNLDFFTSISRSTTTHIQQRMATPIQAAIQYQTAYTSRWSRLHPEEAEEEMKAIRTIAGDYNETDIIIWMKQGFSGVCPHHRTYIQPIGPVSNGIKSGSQLPAVLMPLELIDCQLGWLVKHVCHEPSAISTYLQWELSENVYKDRSSPR